MLKKCSLACILVYVINISLAAQTHVSVPLGNPVYIVLEQAQMRGLCGYLPGTKPYSRAMILSIISEIINNNETRRFGGLSEVEIGILEQFRRTFSPARTGLDLMRGTYSFEHIWNDVYFSAEVGFGLDFTLAGGFFPVSGGYRYNNADDPLFEGASHPEAGDFFADISIGVPSLSFVGDLGRHMSYGLTVTGRITKSPRSVLGQYDNTLWEGSDTITAFSEPLAYFPYTYKKQWDGFVFASDNISNGGMLAWPEKFSVGYSMMPELAGEFFNGHFLYRFARLDREWAGMTNNGSLVLNQSAQPFLAFETVIVPFNWIMLSSLTGALEYNNAIGSLNNKAGEKESARSFQNAFSMVMLEVNYKNYFHADIGSSVVWPKRFELGYLFPFADNFLYQNNIGDFDNMALFLNLQGQYPGIGKLWVSLYLDEVSFESNMTELDRSMYAYQLGGYAHIPWLPFSSVTLSYTKIEPYNYTHNRIDVPWSVYEMETNYVNYGSSLGYYIPPNSDEILIRFETIPFPQSMFRFQYQMIRHGAGYGDRAVDGSSLWSELPVDGRSSLKKYFLRDGAYQWMHILKLRGEYYLTSFNLPMKVFCEIGGVYSYFTDTNSELGARGSYRVINSPQYPHSLSFIGILGVQIFPKF